MKENKTSKYHIYDDAPFTFVGNPYFYGITFEKFKMKIDLNRFENNYFTYHFNKEIIKEMKSKAINQSIFIPAKIHYDDYKCNIFQTCIKSLRNDWEKEVKPILSKIKTPAKAGDDAFMSYISNGILEPEECNIG